ncbi:retrotransposon protein, putative, unclassified [Senna tora]|uniref:Retrotransposon protein, putative, unclassified n=1 Tax=Senna tora TaxID=362788 RepID=A0A834WCD0_9FABA|nr:retrotransposon protein, putative, unclassified [Senna tora]
MHAKCGTRPSATWRSLMAGKSLLAKGIRKSIGNGRTTWIWRDQWVPSDPPMVLTHPEQPLINVERVCELITTDGVAWDEEKLHAIFDENTCRHILSVPPNIDQGEDKWVWEHDKNGSYSVKSEYRKAMVETWCNFDLGLDIDDGATVRFWKRLWKLKTISRYKVFLWRACLGIIPTIEALEQRGMSINEPCVMCNNAAEDVFHALIDCPDLHHMWVVAKYDYSSRLYHANILEWLVVEAGDWRDEQLVALAVALYHAWERRNKKKFENEVVRVETLWPRVEKIMDEVQTANFCDDRNNTVPTNLRWEKPEYPFIKLNVDAVVIKDGGGSMGGLLRDETGSCRGAFMNTVSYPHEPTLLEAMAVKEGLKLALKVGCNHVMVEGDARLVMDMLKTPCDQASTLNAVCRDILRFISNFQSVPP